jgi:hypothetical protein
MLGLEFKIVGIGVRPKPNLFNLLGLLFATRLFFFFLLLVAEFSVVYNLTYRRVGLGRNFYKIQPTLACQLKGGF